MAFWDFIFGTKDLGWLKTALIAGFIGMLILGIFGGWSGESENKYYFILPGLPIWWIIKSVYWNSRENQIIELKNELVRAKGNEKKMKESELKRHIDSLIENNIPLWDKLSKGGQL